MKAFRWSFFSLPLLAFIAAVMLASGGGQVGKPQQSFPRIAPTAAEEAGVAAVSSVKVEPHQDRVTITPVKETQKRSHLRPKARPATRPFAVRPQQRAEDDGAVMGSARSRLGGVVLGRSEPVRAGPDTVPGAANYSPGDPRPQSVPASQPQSPPASAGVAPSLTQPSPRRGEGEGEGINNPEPVLTPPVLLSQSPSYPVEGYRIVLEGGSLTSHLQVKASQGRVLLRLLVLTDGTVGRVEVVESSGSDALDRAAVTAARTWRFAPATRDGQPIDAWALIPVRFIIP